jgi:prepilin-type N-terminal cleavage/methylation domain-containing protein
VVRGRGGFSLPEALIALTISSVLVLLVGTVFLVQNDFYSHVLLRSQVQENARAMTEQVATEVRSIGDSAIIQADSSELVVRTPLATFSVCGRVLSDVYVHVPGGTAGITTSDVTGIGYLHPNGTWSWHDVSWGTLLGTGGDPQAECRANGADTTGISGEFYRFTTVDALTGFPAASLLGSSFVLYTKTHFRFASSTLVSGDRALYRGKYGGTLTELATGVGPTAHFEYWGGGSWSKAVTGAANLASITRVRLEAQSQGRGETSRELRYDFGWTVDIPVANAL